MKNGDSRAIPCQCKGEWITRADKGAICTSPFVKYITAIRCCRNSYVCAIGIGSSASNGSSSRRRNTKGQCTVSGLCINSEKKGGCQHQKQYFCQPFHCIVRIWYGKHGLNPPCTDKLGNIMLVAFQLRPKRFRSECLSF
jgi:hypothetical protein